MENVHKHNNCIKIVSVVGWVQWDADYDQLLVGTDEKKWQARKHYHWGSVGD
jgi:hypothetical protein